MKLEWSPTEKFEISGFELETTIQTLTERLLTPEAQKIIREYEALKALQERVRLGIESGKVTQIDEDDGKTV